MSLAALTMITTLVAAAPASQTATVVDVSWFANANATTCNLSGSFASKDMNIVFNRSRARGGELIVHISPRQKVQTLDIDAEITDETITLEPQDGMFWIDGQLAEALQQLLAAGLRWQISTNDASGKRNAYQISMIDSQAPLAAFDACAHALGTSR